MVMTMMLKWLMKLHQLKNKIDLLETEEEKSHLRRKLSLVVKTTTMILIMMKNSMEALVVKCKEKEEVLED